MRKEKMGKINIPEAQTTWLVSFGPALSSLSTKSKGMVMVPGASGWWQRGLGRTCLSCSVETCTLRHWDIEEWGWVEIHELLKEKFRYEWPYLGLVHWTQRNDSIFVYLDQVMWPDEHDARRWFTSVWILLTLSRIPMLSTLTSISMWVFLFFLFMPSTYATTSPSPWCAWRTGLEMHHVLSLRYIWKRAQTTPDASFGPLVSFLFFIFMFYYY